MVYGTVSVLIPSTVFVDPPGTCTDGMITLQQRFSVTADVDHADVGFICCCV